MNHGFEILNVSTIGWTFSPWMRSTLLHNKIIKWAKAKVHVYSDSVLCLGMMYEHSEGKSKASRLPTGQRIQRIIWNRWRTNWVRVEYVPRIHIIADSPTRSKKNWMLVKHVQECEDRVIFMPMLNDIDWTEKENLKECLLNSEEVKDYAKRFPRGHWSFIGPGEEKWSGTHTYKSEGQRNITWWKIQRKWTSNFPRYQCVESGILEKKRWEMCDSLTAGSPKAELLCRTIHSVNQLSIHGAVASWCEDSADSWSNVRVHGEICCKGERSVISKIETARSGFFGTDTNEE